ncbi:MAG: sigma-54-dependent Fis family transcriptional regulator [Myxococcales bacterium]|nr:sigma-54-dependent Fis family transcriptional regulator [Myxococcales bacterium]
MMSTILIVDDEKNILRTLRLVLEGEGYDVLDAKNHSAAEAHLSGTTQIDTILLDVKLGEDNGIELLEKIKSNTAGSGSAYDPAVPVIMISGHASINDAVKATRLGAFDFMEKPLDRNRVVVAVRNAVERAEMQARVNQLRDAADSQFELLGTSQVMVDLRRQISKVAPTRTRVLITGESGTGKELIARAVHRNSNVAGGDFVKVNCAAIPPELIESELFGHERGAFTGATGRKRGLFEVADKGTIFLDEIGDMSLSAQAKVLRVLQTGDFSRVGGEQTLTTDCRVVAATNKDLQKAVADGEFREDLYFRLNVLPIESPPLRDRRDDLPLLLQSFITYCCEENGFATKSIDDAVLDKLRSFEWPGNVRELRNVAERLVIMSDEYIVEKDLPPYLGGPTREAQGAGSEGNVDISAYDSNSLREFRELIETQFIVHRLEEFEWNISQAALSLGIERTNLHKKLRALGIQRPS